MKKMVLAGLFAFGVYGVAHAEEEVAKLTPEQAQVLELQALQTDSQLGEYAPSTVDEANPESYRVACYARDAFRVTYRVIGYGNPNWIQREAVRHCQRMSRVPFTCRALGCR